MSLKKKKRFCRFKDALLHSSYIRDILERIQVKDIWFDRSRAHIRCLTSRRVEKVLLIWSDPMRFISIDRTMQRGGWSTLHCRWLNAASNAEHDGGSLHREVLVMVDILTSFFSLVLSFIAFFLLTLFSRQPLSSTCIDNEQKLLHITLRNRCNHLQPRITQKYKAFQFLGRFAVFLLRSIFNDIRNEPIMAPKKSSKSKANLKKTNTMMATAAVRPHLPFFFPFSPCSYAHYLI